MKNGIIAYLSHKRTENARNKKIIFFAIMKPWQTKPPIKTKKGLISWKTTQTITKRL
ncbi:type I restriction endonuclease [Helicobacter pylori]|uniref:type I restriction endonuclease n=1 Tax=Helicobacter pylori TaxID=210 RepID=UPI0010C7ACD7|nr:type I restriction endonuclease [Helicobacter pylori]WJX98188.1 type I restriction endonuclease [Helicobacter pylori]